MVQESQGTAFGNEPSSSLRAGTSRRRLPCIASRSNRTERASFRYKGIVLEKINKMGRYTVCKCGQHWLWEDKIAKNPHGRCKGCQTPWQESMYQKPKTQRYTAWQHWNKPTKRSYREVLLAPPPGLTMPVKNLKNKKWKAMESAAQQHWDTLPVSFQQTLAEMGITKQTESTPKDLQAIVVEHLESLPADLKAQLQGVLKPKEDEDEKSTAQKLKQQVGQLKDLTNRRENAQAKVNLTKESYKAALADFQELQQQLDKAQEALKASAEQYSKLMLERKIEVEPSPTQIEEEVMWEVLTKAGLTINEDKKKEIQKMMVENHTKKRRTTGVEANQTCG